MSAKWAVGIDLGGTNLKVALVDPAGRVGASASRQTQAEKGPEYFLESVDALVNSICQEKGSDLSGCIVGAGLGTPGPLDLKKGLVIKAANLPGWVNFPLRDRLEEKLRVPVIIENDANAAAYGEFVLTLGGKNPGQFRDMVLLTLGTGVGAGVILNGKVVHGHFDNAGELGHWIVVPGGLPCACGQRGCLEAYSSAGAVMRRFEQALRSGESSTIPGGADAHAISLGAQKGDPLCRRIWDEACYFLGLACVNIQHAFNPEVILFGGGMADAGDFLLSTVRAHYKANRWDLYDDFPRIELARLGANAGIIGAAMLAWKSLASGDAARIPAKAEMNGP